MNRNSDSKTYGLRKPAHTRVISSKRLHRSETTGQRRAPGLRTKGAARHDAGSLSMAPQRCRRKFLRYFPRGFTDETYLAWERGYKWNAHKQWNEALNPGAYSALLRGGDFAAIAAHAVRIESRTNLLFSFEKIALRDSLRSARGARLFAEGLFDLLHGEGTMQSRFEQWSGVVGSLPRRQTRVLTWPILTVFAFIAQPEIHIFLKPNVTRIAARAYGFDLDYAPPPAWPTYASMLRFAETVRSDLRNMAPRDMIDIQSFIWVQGSDEYPKK